MDIEDMKRLEQQKRDIEDYQLEEGQGIEVVLSTCLMVHFLYLVVRW